MFDNLSPSWDCVETLLCVSMRNLAHSECPPRTAACNTDTTLPATILVSLCASQPVISVL